MADLGHFIFFDLTKIGIAYQIINSFVDEETIHAFEISPLGPQALIILSSKDKIALQFVYHQCLAIYLTEIAGSAYIENLSDHVMAAYLSQNQPKVEKNLLIIEAPFVSLAFNYAKKLCDENIEIIDFRIIRTGPPNIILIASNQSMQTLNQFVQSNQISKSTLIEDVQKSLLSYFEVLI